MPGTLPRAVPVFILTQPREVKTVLIFVSSEHQKIELSWVLLPKASQPIRGEAEILTPI